jgi:hypothetical protein
MILNWVARSVPGILLSSALLLGIQPAHSSDAFGLLDQAFRTYADLPSYHSRGELISTTSSPQGPSTVRFETETLADREGGFLLRIRHADDSGSEQVIWREDGVLKQWTSNAGTTREVSSLGSALAALLGPEAMDAAIVPLLLAGDTDLTAPADAASLEGVEACGTKLCDVLVIGQRGGRSLSRIWIDQEDHLIQRLELDVLPPAKLARPTALVRRSLALRYDIEPLGSPISPDLMTFTPPPAPQESAAMATPSDYGIDFLVSEEISVELHSLAVRAVDSANRPIRGLQATDFEVKLGKEEIPVVSADWISSRGSGLELLSTAPDLPPLPMRPRDEADGNLVVLFIQSDFNSVRAKGHLRILPIVRDFLRALEDEDWVAVVSFDSHLKFWLDFSRDRTAAGDATERAIRFGAQPPISPGKLRSLAYSFPKEEAKKAATPEDALRLTARSLIDIPGEKIIVYLGWGLGRYGSSGFRMTRDYDRALATLDAAKASVFVLDVTDADYHTLELGIRQVARDTGGTYAKTDNFARREVMRLVETISGYYLLTLDRGNLPEELEKLALRLKSGGGRVLLREQQLSR